MARKSTAEDIVDIISKLPWWAGILLAAVAYFILHTLAVMNTPSASNTAILSTAMTRGIFYVFAYVGQYLVPSLFVLGALISFFTSIKKKKLHSDVTSGNRKIADISWQDFELLIGEHFRRQGFSVQETSSGADGGIDLVLKKNGETYVVQCKHYKVYKVGVRPVRELLGVIASCGAIGGYVVTSGEFTNEAINFAKSNNIELIDGQYLDQILKTTPKPARRPYNSLAQSPPSSQTLTSSVSINPNISEAQSQICPKCGSPMVSRVARKGSRAGQKFLGCSGYPNCKFIQSLD